MLYTDGTTEATREDADTFIAALDAAERAAAAQETADEIQTLIDADEPLATKITTAGVELVADAIDSQWVVLQFPEDTSGLPAFWAGVTGQIASAHGGKQTGPYTVRVRKGNALGHLTTVAALLPDPVEE